MEFECRARERSFSPGSAEAENMKSKGSRGTGRNLKRRGSSRRAVFVLNPLLSTVFLLFSAGQASGGVTPHSLEEIIPLSPEIGQAAPVEAGEGPPAGEPGRETTVGVREGPPIGEHDSETAVDDPERLAEAAVMENRSIEALRNRIQALEHRAGAASQWSDPVVSTELSNFPVDSWSVGESPMSGVQFKIAQKIPFPGKNRIRTGVAGYEFLEKEWELEEQKNRLRHLVRETYWNLALNRGLERLTERHAALAGRLADAVRAAYKTGKADQHVLLSLQLRESKLRDDLDDFEKKRKALLAVLNAALHREQRTAVGTPAEIPAVAPRGTLPEYLELAETFNPRLKETETRALRFSEAAKGAALEKWPDLTAWGGYRIRFPAGADNGTDFFSLGVSIPLPFDYTNRSGNRRAGFLAMVDSEKERFEAIRDEIGSSMEIELIAWTRAHEKFTAYSERLVPDAARILESALSAYRAGRADYTDLFRAELQLLELERDLLIAKSATRIHRSRMEILAGIPHQNRIEVKR